MTRMVCKCGRVVSADWVELWNFCPWCHLAPFQGWPLAEPDDDDDQPSTVVDHGY